MSTEIKCPKCGTIFTVDESEYASLLEQVRTKEFDASVKKEADRIKKEMQKDAELAAAIAKVDKEQAIAEKELCIARLKEELKGKDENIALRIEKAIADKNKEIYELKTAIQSDERQFDKEKALIEEQYKKQIELKNDEIAMLKDYRMKLSTKMVGESLEQHCENKFNEMRMAAFPKAQFGKDNDAKSGSKGDYIYREFAEDGTEVLSIMFEMKNEVDTTATKHKNEHFFAELDKDRCQKKCEYAILVSMLEQDSELYNTGIVDVSYKYEKMYVIRPQFFIQIISILRNAALNALKYKQDAELARRQNIDVTNFEEKLLTAKGRFDKNLTNAKARFDEAIAGIDTTIKKLQDIKENLRKSVGHMEDAGARLDDLTIRKLTYGNPTMKEMFAAAEAQKTGGALNGKVEEQEIEKQNDKDEKPVFSWLTKRSVSDENNEN